MVQITMKKKTTKQKSKQNTLYLCQSDKYFLSYDLYENNFLSIKSKNLS